jgi:hypothetical protein
MLHKVVEIEGIERPGKRVLDHSDSSTSVDEHHAPMFCGLTIHHEIINDSLIQVCSKNSVFGYFCQT